MSRVISADLGTVWLSPTVTGAAGEKTVLKMLQNFCITLRIEEQDKEGMGAPGPAANVVIGNFTDIVPEDEFQTATLTESPEGWSCTLSETANSLVLTAPRQPAPFSGGVTEYRFLWKDFYTTVSKTADLSKVTVRANGFEGVTGGERSVWLKYPGYITRFEPTEAAQGVVEKDNGDIRKAVYTVSVGAPFEFCWTVAGDGTGKFQLTREDEDITAGCTNLTYREKVSGDAVFTLTVTTDGYPFPDRRQLILKSTDWCRQGTTDGTFDAGVFKDTDLTPGLFWDDGKYFAYLHPDILTSTQGLAWEKLAENTCFAANEFTPCASGCHRGIIYIAGKENGSDHITVCTYSVAGKSWEWESTNIAAENVSFGFAFSKNTSYLYWLDGGTLYANAYSPYIGWNGNSVYFEAPEALTVLSVSMCFHIKKFYAGLLCAGGEKGKWLYLYDLDSSSQRYLRKIPMAEGSTKIMLLSDDNGLWAVSDRELADCITGQRDLSYYPPVGKGERAWLGSRPDGIFGIFPDKNYWRYQGGSGAGNQRTPGRRPRGNTG